MRVCAFAPDLPFNYFCGVTNVKLKDYILGSFGFALTRPAMVYIAVSIKDIAEIANGSYETGTESVVILALGISSSVILMIVTIVVTWRKMKALLAEEMQDRLLDGYPPQEDNKEASEPR